MKDMKSKLFIIGCITSFLFLLSMLLSKDYFARILGLKNSSTTQVLARVGEHGLSISGFASPFASIVLTIDGVFARATVADGDGNFSLLDVLIRKTIKEYCLEHIDFKRIGDSKTCFKVSGATQDIRRDGIFLPPTIGLLRSEIAAGGNAVVFGYTMPGATVTIHMDNGMIFTITADQNGYYEHTLTNLKAGVYELFATAVYNKKPSENPSDSVRLVALSWWQQIIVLIKRLWKWLVELFTGLGLGPLWLLFPLIPLITFFVLKIWPEKFTFIYNSKLYGIFRPRERKLHHAWMFGY